LQAYACDFPIPGWGQSAGTCDYFENTILNPDDDMVGSIGIFGSNEDYETTNPNFPYETISVKPRTEVPFVLANIAPNTDYLFSYVRRSVTTINITTGYPPLPLTGYYNLEPTHAEISTYNWQDMFCFPNNSHLLSLLPLSGSVMLLSDNRFGGANPPFAWKQIVAAVRTGNTPTHNALYCYIRRDNPTTGKFYLEIDHFEMIRDVFIANQSIALNCTQTSVEIGAPALCANTDLLNMRYRWFQSTNGGTTWQWLSDLDNQTSITVSPTITTQYKLVRYMAEFFIASDGTTVPIETIDSPTNTVQKEAIITVTPYYFTDPASNSPDIMLPAGATTNWQPGTHPFLPQFTGSAANPIRIAGTITIPDGATLNITDLHFDFGPNGRILVHPIGRVNLWGANLSGDPICNNMWQGIRTFGNGIAPLGGMVVTDLSPATNQNTIIGDALIGISTQNLPLIDLNNINAALTTIPDFNTITNLTNFLFPALWSLPVISSADGFLFIQNARFENCFMGINTAWKPSHNDVIRQSTFNTTNAGLLFPFLNATWITQGEAGIFSMFSPRLSADACTFQNLKYGIRTNVVADFRVPNVPALFNTFTNCRVGISARNFTSAAFANTNIRNNLFTNCETAIQCQGTNADIRGNTITNSAGQSGIGMLMMGSAYVIARNNQITNVSRGIVSVDTDLLGGFIHGNTITNTQVAIPNIGDNTSVTIMCNTLNNYQLTAISVAPWLTTAQTGILANQGNCPTFNTALNTFTQPAGGPLFPDLYLHPTNTNLYTYSEYAQMLPPGFTASPGVLSLCNGGGPPPANWSPIDICNQFAPQRIANAADVRNLPDEREQEIQTSLWIQHYGEQGDTAQLTAF